MRKFFLLLILGVAFVCNQSNAQTERGTLLLGGGANFQMVDDASVFVFNANLGVFVKQNFAIGLQASILSSDGVSAWSLGPYTRLYFGKNEKGKFFGQAGLSLLGSTGFDVEFGGGLGAGYAVFLNKSIVLEFGATYSILGDMEMLVLGAGFQIHFRK